VAVRAIAANVGDMAIAGSEVDWESACGESLLE